MDTTDPALVTVQVGLAQSTAGGAAVALPTGHLRAAPVASSSVVPRKRLGNIIVQGGAPAPGATVAAAKVVPQPKARPPVAATVAAAGNIGDTEAPQLVKKKVVLKRKRAPPAKKAPASSTPATAAVPPVFDGMPARYVRPFWDFLFAAVGGFSSRIRRLSL